MRVGPAQDVVNACLHGIINIYLHVEVRVYESKVYFNISRHFLKHYSCL